MGRRKRAELLGLLRPCFARVEPWLQARADEPDPQNASIKWRALCPPLHLRSGLLGRYIPARSGNARAIAAIRLDTCSLP